MLQDNVTPKCNETLSPADSANDFRTIPRRFDLARCLSFRCQRIVSPDHIVTLGTEAIALPPRPGQRSYAGDTVELSHQLDGSLLVYRGDQLLLKQVLRFWNTPIVALLHAPPRRNANCRASTTSPVAPLWRPSLNR